MRAPQHNRMYLHTGTYSVRKTKWVSVHTTLFLFLGRKQLRLHCFTQAMQKPLFAMRIRIFPCAGTGFCRWHFVGFQVISSSRASNSLVLHV